jgi:hypothetical protein
VLPRHTYVALRHLDGPPASIPSAPRGRPYPWPMDDRRNRLIAAMQELLDAHAAVRVVMDGADAKLRFGMEQLAADAEFLEAMAAAPSAVERQDTLDAFRRITEARHEVRLLLLEECLEEGMSAGEVGVRWGVSRQRVAKLVGELRARRAAEAGTAAADDAEADES